MVLAELVVHNWVFGEDRVLKLQQVRFDAFETLEIRSVGNTPVDFYGFGLGDGVHFVFDHFYNRLFEQHGGFLNLLPQLVEIVAFDLLELCDLVESVLLDDVVGHLSGNFKNTQGRCCFRPPNYPWPS